MISFAENVILIVCEKNNLLDKLFVLMILITLYAELFL